MNIKNSVYLETDAVYTSHYFYGNEIRCKFIEEELWLIFKDICDALEIKNPSRVIRTLGGDAIYKSQCITRYGRCFVILIPLQDINSFLYRMIQQRNSREISWHKKCEKIVAFSEWISVELIPFVKNYEGGNV